METRAEPKTCLIRHHLSPKIDNSRETQRTAVGSHRFRGQKKLFVKRVHSGEQLRRGAKSSQPIIPRTKPAESLTQSHPRRKRTLAGNALPLYPAVNFMSSISRKGCRNLRLERGEVLLMLDLLFDCDEDRLSEKVDVLDVGPRGHANRIAIL